MVHRRDAETQRKARKRHTVHVDLSRWIVRPHARPVSRRINFFPSLRPLRLCGESFRGAPKRIVSTSPSITEILYALGLGDRVVGVTTVLPLSARGAKKPKIGRLHAPEPRSIVGAAAGSGHPRRQRACGSSVKAGRSRARSGAWTLLPGIYVSIRAHRQGGRRAGAAPRAQRPNPRRVGRHPRAHCELPRRRIFFVVGRDARSDRGHYCRGPQFVS